MNIVAIVQARMNSTRLPGKVMMEVKGKPLIGYTVDRLNMVQRISGVVVAVPPGDYDSALGRYVRGRGDCTLYAGGAENDLVERFIGVLDLTGADGFVRVCGDSPLVDPYLVQEGVDLLLNCRNGVGFFSNAGIRSLPPGNSVEGCHTHAYKAVAKHCTPEDREHAGFPWLYRQIAEKSMLVDTPEDFERVSGLINSMYRDHKTYGWFECLSLL